MITHPNIDPVAFRIWDWPVHWYGMMWCAAFLSAAVAGKWLAKKPALAGAPPPEDLITAGIVGALAGGRIGYALFYDFAAFAEEPLRIVQIWQGGMSFHGGLLGVALALFFAAKQNRQTFLRAADFAAVLAPIGLGLGRIGNFINGELPGRAAPPDLPWAMLFPGDDIARHPSPLYQALLEGAVLGALMLFLASGKKRPPGVLAAAFLLGYGFCRFASEFFRQPDAHLGLFFGGVSMGQILSVPMILLGGGILFWLSGGAKTSKTMAKKWRARLAKFWENTAPAPAPEGEYAAAAADMPADIAEDLADLDEAEEDDALPEKPEELPGDSAKPRRRWWQNIFNKPANNAAPPKIRAFSRRDKRRQKKKKRG